MAKTGSGWVVGRAAGVPVVLSPGWLLAAVLLTVLFYPTARVLAAADGDRSTSGAALLSLAVVLMLFASTFLHELAHAVVARRHGMQVRQIVLTLLGGHTEFAERAPRPGASALVAIAGPAANLVIGLGAYLVWKAVEVPGGGSALLLAAAVTNGFVGAFNLLPGLPLDGGRVLESIVWTATGRRSTGTTVAAWAGHGVALAVVAWVLLPALLSGTTPGLTQVGWGALIAAFLWSGASQSRQAARNDRAVDGLAVRALAVPAVALPVTAPVVAADRLGDPAPQIVLLAADGAPVGYVDPEALAAVPPERRQTVTLAAVGVPLPPGAMVDVALTGHSALAAVAEVSRTTPVMAVVANGRVVGLLRAADVARAMRAGT
ncbi:site-2 protease family protein [Actinotalea sp.]|uniref:site-2 protease family protein n=1 Tax=Actinotalea sp. TaxID=1872145 RepID=UPI003568FDCF